ncbi:MAG TPA: hypothetical protein DHV16_08715 [Nitrospiraceae bacterium]|nr:MAG: hypothetical protein A2Z82_01550 [Nitrospirae bacterium GWA2_46_11]OGW26151.1 MAG: hypothetical protein A2X55_03790 [Nitrospirae bacterium GWB2_47_37]HAK88773.1 hypothetical protein [Nitrospiraceae bacterium]HCZ12314.1 hypothetical protein [Nitrospiraceae bacterium]
MKRKRIYNILLSAVLCILSVSYAYAAVPVGKLIHIEGQVDILREGKLPAVPAKTGDAISVKDIIRTKSASKAEVAFIDGNILKIAQRSRIDINEYTADGKSSASINMPRGKVEANIDKKITTRIAEFPTANKFEIRTPAAVAGVRGTKYFTFHERGVTGILVKEGKVETFNPKFPNIKVQVTAGQITTVSESRPPAPPRSATDAEKKGHEKDTAPSEKPKDNDKPKDTAKAEGQPKSDKPAEQQPSNQQPSGQSAAQPAPSAPVAPPPPPPVFVDPMIIAAPPPPLPAFTYVPPPPPPITETTTTTSTSSTFKVPITIKLTWGQNPNDLDAHLWVPQYLQNGGETSHFNVYYGNTGNQSVYPYARLDQDVTGGYGPETITVHKLLSGNYYYSVKCFGCEVQSELTGSNAQVEWKDNAGTTYNFNVPTSGDGYWWNVFKFTEETLTTLNNISSSSTALNFMKTINGTTYALTNGFNAFYRNGSTNIWSDNPAYINLLGYYIPGVKQHDVWYGNVHSYNSKNYTATTYDGGAYYGFLGGIKAPASGTSYDNVEGGFMAIYIDPADSNGISRAGILKGTLNGVAYPYMELMDIDGTIYRTQMLDNIDIIPANLVNSISKYSISSNSNTSFMFNGNGMGDAHSRPYSYNAGFSGINGLGWGVYNANTTGSYSGISPSDNWNWSMTHNDITRITGMEANGTQWSGNIIKAEHRGYYADITSNAHTGIYVGELKGTFNPMETGGTWMAVSTGVYMETNQLLNMLAVESGKSKLQQLNIPVVEVGRANFSGNGNNLTVNMNDVIFLANQSGQKATMWATGSVSGSYTAAPTIGTAVTLNGTSGFTGSVDFTPKVWDTGNNKWLSTVSGSGDLSGGSYTGTVIMKGAGAGTINQSNSTFSGTAAGTAK